MNDYARGHKDGFKQGYQEALRRIREYLKQLEKDNE